MSTAQSISEADLFFALKERTAALRGLPGCATMEHVAQAESALGFALPPLYVRLVTEIANGGFGPGNGILGLPPNGFADPNVGLSIVDAYRVGRDDPDFEARVPEGLLFLVYWDAEDLPSHGVSCIDCIAPGGPIVTPDALPDRIEYHLTAPSLLEWLARWTLGELTAEYQTIVRYENLTNPFTGEDNIRRPIFRVEGPLVDFSRRL